MVVVIWLTARNLPIVYGIRVIATATSAPALCQKSHPTPQNETVIDQARERPVVAVFDVRNARFRDQHLGVCVCACVCVIVFVFVFRVHGSYICTITSEERSVLNQPTNPHCYIMRHIVI